MNNALGNQDCPPIMEDGRHVTDYRPICYVNDLIMKQNGINNSYDYKALLQHNALKLQEVNRQFYNNKNACHSCEPYYLADPNNHVDYWQRYDAWIGYQTHSQPMTHMRRPL